MGKFQPFDLIRFLLYYDLIELCFKIFNQLEAKSLTNCRLVSSHWKNFIDYQFNEMPKGRNSLRQKLLSNIFDENYKPGIKHLPIEQPFHLVSDTKSICISNKSGSISNYNFHSLEHIWTVKVCDRSVLHCMNSDKVFVVTSAKEWW